MERLLELLKDGRSRTLEMIAAELGITMEQLDRDMEFLERSGIIKRIDLSGAGASSCAGCSGCPGGETCPGCMPEGGFKNMGIMWEVMV